MKNFSYTKTPELINKIEIVEDLRKNILLTPIPFTTQVQLKFECTLNNISLLYFLETGKKIDDNNLKGAIKDVSRNKIAQEHQHLIDYKNILDEIYFHWTAVKSTIDSVVIDKYYSRTVNTHSKISEANSIHLQQLLQYAQASADHPILQAGLVHGMIATEQIYGPNSSLMGFLTQIIFLYKNGYGVGGMYSLGTYLIDNYSRYKDIIVQARSDANMTPLLEFMVIATTESLTSTYKSMITDQTDSNDDSLALNDRQKQILFYLNTPNTKITNKTVQNLCKISPITATRDLAKLVNYGIILPLGKGRSTYYTVV